MRFVIASITRLVIACGYFVGDGRTGEDIRGCKRMMPLRYVACLYPERSV